MHYNGSSDSSYKISQLCVDNGVSDQYYILPDAVIKSFDFNERVISGESLGDLPLIEQEKGAYN